MMFILCLSSSERLIVFAYSLVLALFTLILFHLVISQLLLTLYSDQDFIASLIASKESFSSIIFQIFISFHPILPTRNAHQTQKIHQAKKMFYCSS